MVKIGDKKFTHIYQGNNLILEDNQETKDIKIGDKKIDFVFQGNKVLYPNPIIDNLVLWYDFKSLNNTSFNKDIAKDLSNNSDGTLRNFSYTDGSGYNNGLDFDGIDDYISLDIELGKNFTISLIVDVENIPTNYILSSSSIYFFVRKNGYHLDLSLLNNGDRQEQFRATNFFIEFLNKKINISYVINSDDKKVYMYINESLYTTFNMEKGARSNMKITGLGIWRNNYFFKGSLYNFKVYDRPLDNQEIKHNYNLEKERWNL